MRLLRSLDDVNSTMISELYRQHASALLTHLRINTRSIEDAEDLLLDVFIAAMERQSLQTLPLEQQRFWLWRVTHNKLIDYYRKHARHQQLPLEELSETAYQDGEFEPEWTALRNEEYQHLRAALENLPPLQKEVILLRFVDGLKAPEIASILGKRDAAVRMILSRTLNLLRKKFEKRLG